MKSQADKSQENQRRIIADDAIQQQAGTDAALQFVDNRAETTQLRQLQATVDNSPQVKGLAQLQAMVDSSPRLIAQRQAGSEDEELPHGQFVSESTTQLAQQPVAKPNNTGLPDNLKFGIENLSGLSMNNVTVHYNSSQPAQLNAHAYAQGTDIHLAPGQEQHLPHEAWHVVQQAQGRVKPTMQMKDGVAVNDDQGLEREADVMGEKAVQRSISIEKTYSPPVTLNNSQLPLQRIPINRVITGITHLVLMKGKSIFQGNKIKEVTSGDIVRIETMNRYRSRRGPNQEIFREEDAVGEHIYLWFKVLSVNGELMPDKVFVREDTFRHLTLDERLSYAPTTIGGAMSDITAKAFNVNEALLAYIKTGIDVSEALIRLASLTNAENMKSAAPNSAQEEYTLAASQLEDALPNLQVFAKSLMPLGDGAREPAMFFMNQLSRLLGHMKDGMPPSNFVKMISLLPKKALKLLGKTTEMGMPHLDVERMPALPEVGEHMESVTGRYDVLSRKCSVSTRRVGAIHEVDLAMMPRTRGISDIKATINESGQIIIEPGQAERAFAIGYIGAITFEGDLSNQGGERFYAVLFPKGWLAAFSQDVRTSGGTGGSAREPGADEFSKKRFIDKEAQIQIQDGKAFLIRAEESTGDEGQITMHMDRNQLLFGGKPMMQFIREASIGTVEFNKDGNVLYLQMF